MPAPPRGSKPGEPAAGRESLALRADKPPPADLVEFLCANTGHDLNALARHLGLATRYGKKAAVAGAIASAVTHDLAHVLTTLTADEQAVLREAAAAEAGVDPQRFQAKYETKWPVWDAWSYPPKVSALPAFGRVDEDGLFVLGPGLTGPLHEALGEPPPLTIRVADEIAAVLRRQPRWEGGPSDERPVHVSEGAPRAFAEARRVLTLIRAGKVAVTDSQRRPTEASVRRVAEVLVGGDFDVEEPAETHNEWYQAAGPIRAHAWPVLAQQCGWSRAKAGKLALTAAGGQFLAAPDAQQYRTGFERLVLDDSFDELNRIPTIRGQGGAGKRHATSPSYRRHSLVSSMVLWPPGRWVPFQEACRFAWAVEGRIVVHMQPIYLYIGERQYGHLANDSADLTAQYFRALLFESLATLGLVDAAYTHPHRVWPELGSAWGTDDLAFCSRYDGLQAVRLNALGSYCLGQVETYEAQPQPVRPLLSVLPNREIAIVGDPADAVAALHVLEQFAVKKGDHLWQLDRRRILDTVEAGGSVLDVTDFLARNATDGVPHTVEVFLADIAAKTSAFRAREEAVIIEMRDGADAMLVAGDPETRRYCQRLGEAALVVRTRDFARFRSALKKAGYALPPDL
jgi:hypothetical protein